MPGSDGWREHFPSYGELPVVPGAPARSAWGLWGSDDELGTLNQLTDERRMAAVGEVREGRVFNLNLPCHEPRRDPSESRQNPRHELLTLDSPELGVTYRDDYLDGFWLQGSTQWDAVSHVVHPEHGNFNGVVDDDIHTGPGAKLGVDSWAADAIVGRAVLADVDRFLEDEGRPLDHRSNTPITAEDLRATLAAQGVDVASGDILLLRTGWLRSRRDGDGSYAESSRTSPGLEPSDEMLEYLWELRLSAIAADNNAVECLPAPDASHTMRLHLNLLPLWGMPLGELWYLDELAEACHRDGRYACMVVSVPLRVRGGVGTPANAVALR